MNYSRTAKDGSARDEALKRRNGVVREALEPAPKPKRDAEQPAEQTADEKPSESPAGRT